MFAPIRHRELSNSCEFGTYRMPYRLVVRVPGQRTQRDVALTLLTEEAGRGLGRAAGQLAIGTVRVELGPVRGEDVVEDQPLAVETMEVLHQFPVVVGDREVAHLPGIRVEIHRPGGRSLVGYPETAVEAGECIVEVHRVSQSDGPIDRAHGLLEVGLVLLEGLGCVHPEVVEPILARPELEHVPHSQEFRIVYLRQCIDVAVGEGEALTEDRKSTRLNSSHVASSYAVFCLTKKNCR